VGKTRLAWHVAANALADFPDGVFVVDLAALTDPALVPSAAAMALGLREHSGQSLSETLIAYLRDRRLLLLFDNFEHLLPAATLVSSLIAATPQVKVLATSRARLGLQAEYEYDVETLPVPDLAALLPPAELERYDAVALFVARARALRPNFVLTTENAHAVAAICARLDGLPLALELAAARIKLLPPATLRQRLESRLATLTGGARDLPARQRTVRATIAWSHDLLMPDEAVLFRRLSAFVGGWTIEGAEAVAAVGASGPIDALAALSGLVDQNMIDERPRLGTAADEPRYSMLETIREFASEQLEASGEAATVERAFEAFLAGQAEAAEHGLKGSDQLRWLGRLEAEHDNLRVALGRTLERGDGVAALRLTLGLWEFWEIRGYRREGRASLERALAAAESADPKDRAAGEFAVGRLAFDQGDYDAAEGHYQKSLELLRQVGDPLAEAETLSALAKIAVNRLAYEQANDLGEEALKISRQSGDRRSMASALQVLGMIAREQGKYDHALELFEESLAVREALGDAAWTARITSQIGFTHRLAGNAEQAQRFLAASKRIQTELGDRFALGVIANDQGHLAFDAGDVDRAIGLYAEALQHFDAVGGSEALVEAIEWIAVAAAAKGNPVPALRLFGSAAAAREALRLPPRLESDEQRVVAGLDRAMRAAGPGAGDALAAGHAMSLDHARDEALSLAETVAGQSSSDG
jgi:predicted ATPase